jgi:hypothetical protein
MRIQMISMAAIALCLVACEKQPPPAEEPTAAVPDEVSDTVADAAGEQDRPAAVFDPALVEHMHQHADQMDAIMFALDDNDLEGAAKAASWLGGHDTPEGLSDEWRPYLVGMREAATSVELAPDIESARAAAEEISTHCQECHAAAGIVATR